MKYDDATYRITDSGNIGARALIVGIAGLAVSAIGYFLNPAQFFHSYLNAFIFWFSVAIGSLFFVMLHHLVAARWSVTLRRVAENIMMQLPLLLLFFLPLLLGMHELFHWSHLDAVEADLILQKKAPYLNVTFFVIRAAVFFGVWIALSVLLSRASLKQDLNPEEAITRRMRVISAMGIIAYAFSFSFASFDWLMSLDAHWYSTIFGVYIFSGSLVAIISFLVILIFFMRRQGILRETVSTEHFHDLGKLLFAFTVFWAYIAFSQYFLIWYANIPEETIWFRNRWVGSWKGVSLLLVLGHFVIPFFILITRSAKRNPAFLAIMASWMLFMHWVDLYWVIMPGLQKQGFNLSWFDLTAFLGIGGIFVWLLLKRIAAYPLVPVKDPQLKASVEFTSE
ncbi:MAG: hypothetical protein HRF51_11155 [bacterium]|jgi:hypothetical protein